MSEVENELQVQLSHAQARRDAKLGEKHYGRDLRELQEELVKLQYWVKEKARWKLSPMDIASRDCWVDFSRAKDAMFEYTDTRSSPWHVVDADDKKRARLNCINHIVETIPYEDVLPPRMKLPARAEQGDYIRPPLDTQTFVPPRFQPASRVRASGVRRQASGVRRQASGVRGA